MDLSQLTKAERDNITEFGMEAMEMLINTGRCADPRAAYAYICGGPRLIQEPHRRWPAGWR